MWQLAAAIQRVQICAVWLDCRERFGSSENWTPHATLYLEDAPEVCRALPLVLKEFSQFQGRIEALLLYEFFPTRFLGRFPLKGIQ